MAAPAKMEMIGFKELDKLLKGLPAKVERVVLRKVATAMSTPVLKSYRRNVKSLVGKVTGRLLQAPARKMKTYPRTQTVIAIVGPKLHMGGRQKVAPHAHLVEFGTGPRVTKAGKSTGRMPAYAPLRKAYDANLGAIRRIAHKKTAEAIKAEAKKLARRHRTQRTR